MRACVLLIVLAGCFDLADLESPPHPVDLPLVSLPLGVRVTDGGLSLVLTTQSEYDLPCPRLLPTFVATLDEQPLSIERGYVTDEGLDSPDYVCTLPTAHTAAHGHLLHIADETATFDIDLGDASSARTMQLSGTTISHQQGIDVTWSAADDLASAPTIDAVVELAKTWIPLDATIEGSVIHTSIPNNFVLPAAGPGSLSVTVVTKRPCSGGNCTVTVSHKALQPVTVQ